MMASPPSIANDSTAAVAAPAVATGVEGVVGVTTGGGVPDDLVVAYDCEMGGGTVVEWSSQGHLVPLR